MNFENCNTIIFDLDGTLADTAEDIQQALALALAEHALPPIDVRTVRFLIGGGERALIVRALERQCQDVNVAPVDHLADVFHREYLARRNASTRLFPGVREGLERLHAQGMRLGICSNKPDDLTRYLVSDLGIDDLFSSLVGASPTLPRKPDPTGLRACIDSLGGTSETTLYVGDSETDVATARAAGCRVALVSYGYTARPAPQLGADAVIDAITDIETGDTVARSA